MRSTPCLSKFMNVPSDTKQVRHRVPRAVVALSFLTNTGTSLRLGNYKSADPARPALLPPLNKNTHANNSARTATTATTIAVDEAGAGAGAGGEAGGFTTPATAPAVVEVVDC